MFSQRTGWSLSSNQLIARLTTLQNEGKPIIDLTESNPTRCGISYPQDEILSVFHDTKNIIYEPSSQGIVEARRAICGYYKEKSFDISSERIFLTASTSEGYSFLFRLLLNPHDHILVPRPSYPLFEYLANLNDVAIDNYSLVYEDGWDIDMDSLEKSVSSQTRAIVLVNPNNPTGSFVKREEIAQINRMCQKYNLAIICDEVFLDYPFDGKNEKSTSLVGNPEVLTFVLSGISKSLGLPQMKLGWGVVSGPKDLVDEAINRLEIILDTYLSVNTPAQNALKAWFLLRPGIQKEIHRYLNENRQFLFKNISTLDQCSYLNGEGGWYAVLSLPKKLSEEDWVNLFLEKDYVFTHPGYFFDFQDEPYVVLSLLCAPEIFKEGVSRVINRIKVVLS